MQTLQCAVQWTLVAGILWIMDCDVHKSKVKDNTASRFGPLVNGELRLFSEGQENRNTKYNTKWALNVFEKWRVFGEFGILKTTTA